MNTLTPILDIDQKIDIIDHVNQDHTEELKIIAQANHRALVIKARIIDMFQEGMSLELEDSDDSSSKELFIPFVIEGDLEEKILYLAYAAAVKQGKDLSGNNKCFFEVTHSTFVTENMVRLTVRSSAPLPEYYPGYAFAFLLKQVTKRPDAEAKTSKKSWAKKLSDRFFIWLMRHLSRDKRQKLLENANKDVRLYTLRKSWHDNAGDYHGYIDIFTHGNTKGSQWVQSLKVGDIIMSRSGHGDKHAHLSQQQALLIADETSFPALAGILEHWQNPLPPYVILLTASQSEQMYFNDNDFPSNSKVHRIVCPPEQQAVKVLEILPSLTSIESVWAALESDAAKQIRHYLRNQRQLQGKQNHTKAYWSLKSKRNSEQS
ncbi:siderophore-interacting protein [Marinomonas fungiae]|uniref:siderophore-interacting protein n=1 Tax=Marinomonas fungiae TaxID=1137284 RepID=UPI003A8FD223